VGMALGQVHGVRWGIVSRFAAGGYGCALLKLPRPFWAK
jgi:hypothetical protein